MLAQNEGNCFSAITFLKIFWGGMPPDPPRGSALWATLLPLWGKAFSHSTPITTSCRFKCVPQILGSLSIHIFNLLFFLITHSCRVFADHAAHFAERKFFDVVEKYFFCFQPVLGIKIVTQRNTKIHGRERQIPDDEIFFKQKNEFTNV